MAIEVVIFDVDGVLVRAGEFGKLLESRHNIGPDKQQEFFAGPFQECVRGRADLREAIVPFLEGWGWSGSVDDCLTFWFEADAELNEAALRTAADLRRTGYKCYIASTQERHRSVYLENVLGFGGQFDGAFFSWSLGMTKGDPRFFEIVTERLGVPPSAILFFDDVDGIVDTARSVGWNAEVYRFGDDLHEMLRNHDVRIADA